MENTYTFSRALHMMRYGGAKMRCLEWTIECTDYVAVTNGLFIQHRKDGHPMGIWGLSGREIMGSWVEVVG